MNSQIRGRGGLSVGRPGRRVSITLLVALLPLFGGACDRMGGGDVVELERGEVRLPQGASRRSISLGGVVDSTEIEPALTRARPGDALVFQPRDALTHSVAFLAERLQPAQREFLERTAQLRSPPLLSVESRWVVSLDGAPPGRYPFVCVLHGGQGTVEVAAPRS